MELIFETEYESINNNGKYDHVILCEGNLYHTYFMKNEMNDCIHPKTG